MDWFNPFENSEGGGGGGSGTDNYNELLNKPSINNTTLSGNKNSDDLGLQAKIDSNHKLSSDNVSDLGAQNLFTNATEKQNWNAKQDAIQNLQDIQSGAAAGATAVQTISINGVQQTKDSGNIDLPAYPTTLPASDTTNLYDPTGTSPVNGKAVAAALGTLDVESVGGVGKYISEISETNGKIYATPTTMDTSLSNSSTNNNCPTSKTVYDDQQRQETEIGVIANAGAKNLLKNERTTTTHKGIKFTINNDGSVTADGTNDGTGASVLDINTQTSLALSNGDYILTGCPAGGSDSGYMMDITRSPGSSIKDTGSGATFTVGGDYTVTEFRIVISRNVTVDNLTFYPMIRHAEITDSTFVPYAKTNRELTVENDSQQSEIDYAVNTGVKNLLDVQRPTTTTRTSYTPLANGGVELSCSNATWTSYAIADIPVEVGKEYIITFLLDESSGTSNFYFFLRNGNSSGTNLATKNYGSATGNYEVSFTPSNSVIWLGIYLNNSATAATATAKLRCMIRPAAITDQTYEPYALSNPVITPALIKQVDDGSKNIANWSADTQTINNVKFVVEDGTVTVSLTSGTTATARSQKILSVVFQDDLESGTYVLSGAPKVTDGGLYLWDSTAGTRVTPTSDTGNGTVFTFDYDKTHKYNLTVDVANGYSIPSGTTLVYKPMICTAADWAVSKKFVPYAPTNRELYEKVDGLGTELVANTNLDNLNIGTYYCGGATIGATLLNSPTHQPFRLIVSYFQSPTNMMQKIIDFNTGTSEIATYIRVKTSSGWKSWYKFEGTEVTS